MKQEITLYIPPEYINDNNFIAQRAAESLNRDVAEILAVIQSRRSIDARSKDPVFRINCDVYINELPPEGDQFINYQPVKGDKKVIIVGSGPAGLFAALRLIELGVKPIIFERGKDVRERRRDIRNIQQEGIVNPDSNYCFGEGGAGTYSDGKLYTRSTKRGDIKKTIRLFVQHGADPEILVDSHPHIGSNKLPQIIQQMRETILRCGGEFSFNSRVTDFIIKDNVMKGVVVNDSQEHLADAVLLAVGHSARDMYYLLHSKNLYLESKAFALGVRIEHPQRLINEIQYHSDKTDNLPAASYNLACNIGEKGIYSFCMCPGGLIVPAATSPGEIVVNGMSQSRRDSPFANAGFVVSVTEADWKSDFPDPIFGGLHFQHHQEKLAFKFANETQRAPAQRITDFMINKVSSDLPKSSYIPGLTSAPIHEFLPTFIVEGLKFGLKNFNNMMKGYYTSEAIITAVESRTSSPIRITRNKEDYMHVEVKGLFPSGEGAGYAGGIVSAAIDGENCANAAVKYVCSY